jgi:hypothetical protein
VIDVLSTIWGEYSHIGEELLKAQNMNYLIIENDESYIINTHVFEYLVGIKSNKNVNLGQLKIQMEALVKVLSISFSDFKHLLTEESK